MRKATQYFVALAAITAAVSAGVMAYWRPAISGDQLSGLAFLFALAIGAEMLAFVLPRKVRGSMAFIPYLASILIVPSWVAVAGVMAVKFVLEVAGGNDKRKALFNAS